jgi:hypothetical protein
MKSLMTHFIFITSIVILSFHDANAARPEVKNCGDYHVTGTVVCNSDQFCGIIGSKGSLSEFKLKFAYKQDWYSALENAHLDGTISVVRKSSPPSIVLSSFRRIAPTPNRGDKLVLIGKKECVL